MRCVFPGSPVFAALLLLIVPAFGQHATRVFGSKSDSSSFYKNEALLRSLSPRPGDDHFRDSLTAVQRTMVLLHSGEEKRAEQP